MHARATCRPAEWRPADDLSDGKVYLKAHCDSPPPYASRGANYVPEPQDGSARVAPYDPATGTRGRPPSSFVLDSQGSATSTERTPGSGC